MDASQYIMKDSPPPTREVSQDRITVCQPHVDGTPMLVLSRKKNESIIINDNIVITVVEIRGDKVRLGFDAPKDVPIHRQEVYDAIKRSEMSADAREE